ncbi:hypothetical protein BDY19DRAFT_953271 [Irpex rosettiformis]|uniref:Uncharacterized protein n=1 Tax=Irpex rosettiformis TaxID=378272 RepID=A0ACB8U0P2_9APHY|nr:hypothetical protein BDY19DRAFT_953271 [Irpex rosettiformis]
MTLEPKETAADQVRALMLQKDSIENAIKHELETLKSNNCTMQTPLVDAEGFPRADIDVWEVRHARVRVIELRNDLKAIIDSIHKGLQGVFDPSLVLDKEREESSSSGPQGLDPFAKVTGVAPGSPAASAGLLREDLILSFGSLTKSSFSSSSLTPLANLVNANENRELLVRVLRSGDQVVTLTFVPRKGWGGAGLLG